MMSFTPTGISPPQPDGAATLWRASAATVFPRSRFGLDCP
jgi:hypothetical protein